MPIPGDRPRPRLSRRERAHVALVCDYSLAYLGGAQTALLQEAAALAAAGVRVTVVTPSSPHVWSRVRPHPAVRHLRVPPMAHVPGLDLPVVTEGRRLRRDLAGFLRRRGVDVVHLHSEFGLAAAAARAAEACGVPVVHTVHTFFWRGPDRGGHLLAPALRAAFRAATGLRPGRGPLAERPADSALRHMTLATARLADVVISPSAHQARHLRAAGLPAVSVLANVVTGAAAAEPLTHVSGPLRVLWVGRCVPEKRILPFVRAVLDAVARAGQGRLAVTVVGEGAQLAQAQDMAAGCDALTFLGRRPHAEVAHLLAQSHLLALSSSGFDNQPMTIAEAVTARRGVLYCDPALSEGLSGSGILSGPEPAELAATLTDLVRHPERVIEASRGAQAAGEVFTAERHVAGLQEIYAAASWSRNRRIAAAAAAGRS
ncbi:glycosyltransferase family 4 protein [Georgenia deserti]|uniref:Glycosyltransferase family 4 protein n=1 Tax=Georgenia deserti TaxID=2093781 RepID=A0ABW4L034_9MICO